MRKIIFVTAILIALLLLAIMYFLISSLKQSEIPLIAEPTVTSIPANIPPVKYIEISDIRMNDFTSQPIKKNAEGDVLFLEKRDYQMVYYKNYQQFLIDISTPSAEIRAQAEQDFVDKLGISKDQACRLNVVVNTPYVPNPYLSVPPRHLEFCRLD